MAALSLAAAPLGIPPLTGERSASAGEIAGNNQWASDFTLSWSIFPEGGLLRYTYTLASSAKSVSHWLLELSGNCWAGKETGSTACVTDPILGGQPVGDFEFKTHSPGPGNFDLPAPIHGVKFDEGWELDDDGPAVYSFLSERLPMWGSFYVKGGRVSVYNFGLANPGSGNVAHFIAVPDTVRFEMQPVPEPGSVLLLGAGLLVLGYARRRRAR